jgi:prepilin-type processing-associated H-X9-DG protein
MKSYKGFITGLAFVVLAAGLAFAQGPSAAEKVSSRLPEGTIGFAAASGLEQLKPAFDQSSLGQIWNHPGVQAFYAQTRDAIVARIQQEIAKSDDKGAEAIVSILPKLAEQLVQCPVAVGFVEVPVADSAKMPFGVMVIVEAGKRKEAIQPLIDQFEQKVGKDAILDKTLGDVTLRTPKDSGDVPVVWGWYKDTFVLMVNNGSGDWLNGLRNPSNKPSRLTGVPGNGDLIAVYIDPQKIGGIVARAAESDGKNDKLDTVRKILDTLGLRKVQSITARVGLSGNDMIIDKWIQVPAPQTGIFTAVRPVDRKLFARTDARSMTTVAWNVDLATLYDVILKAVRQAMDTDQERQDIDKGIADVETKAGIKIRQGLLASIDGSMVVQAYPSLTIQEVPVGGLALVAGLRDSALFEQQVKALIETVGKDLKPEVLQIRTGKLESGQSQTFLISPALSLLQVVPNWTVADNRLILTTNPNLTTIVLKQYAADKPASASLGDDKTFQALTAKLPANASFVKYSDTAVNARQIYQQLQQIWPMALGMASGQGIALPVSLPDISEQLNGLGKSVTCGYLDKDGIHGHYQGSGLEASAGGSIAGGAIAAAVMLPALAKAKDQSQRVVSMNNLKQIGLACMMYANDHNGEFPPNLEVLVKDGHLTDKILVSPRKPTGHSGPSYIYIAGQKTSSPIENILAYEDPSFAKDGKRIALFLDGHVEALEPGRFQEVLKKTQEQLGLPMSGESKAIPETKQAI